MSFAKKVMSFILAAGMSVIPVLTSAAYATENLYVYDTTIQEKSKALSNDESEPFNVFDIYDAYHEILANSQQPVTTTTTTKATTTKTLPGESQGQGSLVGCRLWGHTELDTTEVT